MKANEKICGVYGLYSKDDECLWVGRSVDILRRFARHKRDLIAGDHHEDFVAWFKESLSEPDAVKLKILENCSTALLNEKESYWHSELKPRFYDQIPNKDGTWNFTDRVKTKISSKSKATLNDQKAAGTYVSSHQKWIDNKGKEYVSDRMKNSGFAANREAASEAGKKGAGKPKSEEQKLKQSETAKRNSSNILFCDICKRPCKGASALGRHKTSHKNL